MFCQAGVSAAAGCIVMDTVCSLLAPGGFSAGEVVPPALCFAGHCATVSLFCASASHACCVLVCEEPVTAGGEASVSSDGICSGSASLRH